MDDVERKALERRARHLADRLVRMADELADPETRPEWLARVRRMVDAAELGVWGFAAMPSLHRQAIVDAVEAFAGTWRLHHDPMRGETASGRTIPEAPERVGGAALDEAADRVTVPELVRDLVAETFPSVAAEMPLDAIADALAAQRPRGKKHIHMAVLLERSGVRSKNEDAARVSIDRARRRRGGEEAVGDVGRTGGGLRRKKKKAETA